MRRVVVLIVAGLMVGPALADWDIGDPHKMHFPQLPDPTGWDVNITRSADIPPYRVVADDWMCSETGPVTDVHFWGSWRNDFIGEVEWIDVAFYADVPGIPGGPYSHPGNLLWSQAFHVNEFTHRPWGTGDQGWYDPFNQFWNRPDHQQIFQYNILIPPAGAFYQVEGTVYWLALSVRLAGLPFNVPAPEFGWKTSLDHWNDDAVWVDLPPTGPIPWNELRDPRPPFESLDMAFVITPEPASLALLAFAGLLIRRR